MRTRTRATTLGVTLLIALLSLAWPAPSGAVEIKLLCTNGMRAAAAQLIPAFERETGHTVTVSTAPSGALVARIKQGESADLAVLTRESLDELSTLGKVLAGSRQDLARSGVGVAVKAGQPKPDVGSADALRLAILAASSIAYSAGVSGVHVAQVLDRLGITEQVKAKTRLVTSGPVSEVLARGGAELGFQQISELFTASGIDYVGPLPAEIQSMTLFSGGVLAGAAEAEAAAGLLTFLAGPAAAPVLARTGMEPR